MEHITTLGTWEKKPFLENSNVFITLFEHCMYSKGGIDKILPVVSQCGH